MTLLALIATAYGAFAGASSLLEAARLLRSGSADDISLSFLGVLVGGYLVWLLYGISPSDDPLIITDGVGLAASTITLSIAARLRGVAIDRGRHTPPFAEVPALERSSGSRPRTAGIRVDSPLPCEDVTWVVQSGSALVAPLARLTLCAASDSLALMARGGGGPQSIGGRRDGCDGVDQGARGRSIDP